MRPQVAVNITPQERVARIVVGLVSVVPFLLRLYRRFGSWQAPVVALGVFAVMFAASALVIRPAINGTGGTGLAPAPAVDHDSYHQ